MKKFLVSLLTLMLALCCTFSVACSIGEEGTGDGDGSNGNGAKGPTVTESQFNEALTATHTQFMVEGESILKKNGVVDTNQSNTIKYVILEDGYYSQVSGQEVYFKKVGGEYFGYQHDGTEWTKVPIQQNLYDANRDRILTHASPSSVVSSYGLVYSALTYNETEKCYVYSLSGEGMSATIKVFFNDGLIVKTSVVATNAEEQEEISQVMNYSYTNLTIDYPQIGGESGGDSSCQHVWEEISLNNGIMTYECSKCQEDKTENVTDFYQSVTNNIANTIFGLADGGTETPSRFSVSLFSDYTWQDVDWSTAHSMNVKGVVMFVKMLADMMDNPNFNITDAPVLFSYSYPAQGETGTALLLYSFDVANDKVVMYWDVQSTVGSNTTNIYIYMDISYDFDTDTLVAFNLASTQSMGGMSMTFGYDYHDENLRYTNDEDYANAVNETKQDLIAVVDKTIDLEADFTEEYSSMMDAMNPNQGGGNGGGNEVNPEKPDVELPSTLRIGISPDYEPFAYYENDKLMGFDIELIYEIANLLGYDRADVELITVDLFDELFLNLETGEYDIVISGIPSTPEREERFNVSISYVEYFVCYEGDNGENVEEFEEYHVFSYNNYELIEVINWSIQILLQNGYIDYLVAYWL